AFARASDAVQFTVEAQTAVQQEHWPSILPGLTDLRIRMGAHTGEAYPMHHPDGVADYSGPAVNMAARVSGVGAGGDIVISDVTRTLASHDIPPDISFLDLGQQKLKGVGVEHLWRICLPAR